METLWNLLLQTLFRINFFVISICGIVISILLIVMTVIIIINAIRTVNGKEPIKIKLK